jgi:maltose alpha-D-glucosyltransferase/alpha-amylase
MPPATPDPQATEHAPPWYKTGVIYEVHVRSFFDANADGVGDFAGLTRKLDYIRDLGITAIWLLPFCPSPLKDDGYDISDYCGVHPKYGTLGDFTRFLREAHQRGLRVITELVINHTSDQHPWFQAARRAPPGSARRDFYVWSDTPEKYAGTRVIFQDVENSNWTWDRVAGAYYWHRFFAHQPDLNFDSPAVRAAMVKVMDFWLDLGVDGLRLDAVPYLFEREETDCENLPETHAFLKMLRHHVDQKYGDRMLLAEANQWPEDTVKYFGGGRGDECHMAFHFPLMPRLFMALRLEDRVPVVDILQQTPAIPETAQWALFLRNHDELTLEMVTDEERDYMYRMYAGVHRARLNLGIRRRLAPLLGNDRKRIELLLGLLFSLPGTPVIYYGDEIGMGDNVHLGDRDGVRTPMQWSADKNAGFSRASPQSLFLPINLDPENHYEAVNVETQERNPHSLLWWVRRLITLYKRWQTFGRGTIEFLHPENRKVFACLRRFQDESILVVANFSRFIQPVELDLSAFAGRSPEELFGRTEFPPIANAPYFLSLGPHAFYWFSLAPRAPARVELVGAATSVEDRPLLPVAEAWEEILTAPRSAAFMEALLAWLPSRRWFAGRNKVVKELRISDTVSLPTESGTGVLTLLEIEYTEGEPESYLVPLACSFGEEKRRLATSSAALILARVAVAHSSCEGVVHDALASPPFCRALLSLIARRRRLGGTHGSLQGLPAPALRRLTAAEPIALEPSPARSEQSHSSVIYGGQVMLKLFRRLEPGIHPELELTRFLSARKFALAPELFGSLEYLSNQADPTTLAILTSFSPQATSLWDHTRDALSRFFERIQALPAETSAPPPLKALPLSSPAAEEARDTAVETLGTYIETARSLGQITATLHRSLATAPDDPAFAPEPSSPHAERALFQSMRQLVRDSLDQLRRQAALLPPASRRLARQVLDSEPRLLDRFRKVYEDAIPGIRIRIHGDYQLRQVLSVGKGFLIIDFEGDPSLPMSERRLKRSPLRDVAGMMRSFHHAAHATLQELFKPGAVSPERAEAMADWANYWGWCAGYALFQAYEQSAAATWFEQLPSEHRRILLQTQLLRKSLQELRHELSHPSDSISLPLRGILDLLSIEPDTAEATASGPETAGG